VDSEFTGASMAIFECNDKGLEQSLRRIYDIVMDSGGHVHDQLVIRAHNNQLCLATPSEIQRDAPLITVPEHLLVPLKDFKLGLDGDDIGINTVDDGITAERGELLELFVDIYNRTGKIKQHRHITPWIYALDDPALFEKLTEARRPRNGFGILKDIETCDRNNLLLGTFIKTRELNTKLGIGQVLMPLIDIANNHPRCQPLDGKHAENGEFTLSIYKGTAAEGSDECYVRYGYYDAHDTFLYYNYSTPDAIFTRSIPIDIELAGAGKLEVHAISSIIDRDNLLPESQDLQPYFPPVRPANNRETLAVGFLPMPRSESPFALRRILASLIYTLSPDMDQKEINNLVEITEKRVITENLSYYDELGRFLEEYKPKAGQDLVVNIARRMVAIQIENIRQYPLLGMIG
jgi:hypothetical protein